MKKESFGCVLRLLFFMGFPAFGIWLVWGYGLFACFGVAIVGLVVAQIVSYSIPATRIVSSSIPRGAENNIESDDKETRIPANVIRDDFGGRYNPATGKYEWGDLRSEAEKRFQSDLQAGKGLEPDVKELIAELIQIGQNEGYLSTEPSGKFNSDNHHIRAREIGERLDKLGGLTLMQETYSRVRPKVSNDRAKGLEYAWRYIGRWEP
jgi:hypothetical protein